MCGVGCLETSHGAQRWAEELPARGEISPDVIYLLSFPSYEWFETTSALFFWNVRMV